MHSASPIIELRQYTLRPGRRDVLIDLFDSKFVEAQERTGMTIIGQFRDLDRPNKFVWLRGFRNMSERAQSLTDFYHGPVWQAHREAANATMIDSNDVLMLRPARPGSAFALNRDRRAHPDGGFVEATILHLKGLAEETEITSFFEQAIAPTVSSSGGSVLAYLVTDVSENNFPSLPVRQGEHVFVWFTGYADRRTLERGSDHASAAAAHAPGVKRSPEVLRLAPTSRSLLNGQTPRCTAIGLDREILSREERR